MIAIFILQIQYITPSLNPLTFYLSLCDKHFLSSQETLIFVGESAFIRIKYNGGFYLSLFFLDFLSLSWSNDTFYDSKVISVSFSGFKESEKAGAGRKCGLNSKLGFKIKGPTKFRVAGAATQTLPRAT